MTRLVHHPSRAASAATLLLAFAACADPAGEDAADALAELVERDWQARLADDPLFATGAGVRERDGELPDPSRAAHERRAERDRELAAVLRELDARSLDEDARVTHSLLLREVEGRARDVEFGAFEIPLDSDSGFHVAMLRWALELPTSTPGELEAYASRLEAAPRYVAAHTENMRAGLRRGMTLPRVIAEGLGGALDAHVEVEPEESVFFAPFADADDAALRARGRRATAGVVEALADFDRFLEEEYAPGSRASLGASELPDGEAYYEWRVRWYTTLDTTPREVHERGLAEVERIRAEMQAVIDGLGFEGDFAAFLAFLRRDPRFYARTPEELLSFASRVCKRVDGLLPRWFERLPRQPYGVEPVPDDIAPRYTGGRYVGAPLDSERAGTYWVNTYDLPSRPLYVIPALSLHEAVPGHHLQIALSKELEGLPEFRRHAYVTAFGEGWALYTEWLGQEMGIYQGPYEEFGRLTYEMWRACRLVVDTGLHAFGWDRQRAIDYLAGHTALSLHECTTEVDRYIAWPGQALAYKTGELELRRLRRLAEERLGEGFDVRAFHSVVLGAGTVTLDLLGERVEAWLRAGGG